MDVCVHCDHELIRIKNGGYDHIRTDGQCCLENVKDFHCGCDTPFLKREDRE